MKFYCREFRNIRIEKRWTINALAEKCNITRQTLSLWEKGKITPSEGRVLQLAKLLNINPNDISDVDPPAAISNKDLTPLVSTAISCMDQNNIQNQQNDFMEQLAEHFKEYSQLSILMRALLDTMQSLFYVKDINLNYLMANKAFVENLGLNGSYNTIGKNDYDVFPKREANKNNAEDKEILRTGRKIVNEERHIIGSKKQKYGLCSKYPIYDNGKIIGVLCHITDITEQKKSEFLRNIAIETIDKLEISLGFYNLDKKEFVGSSGGKLGSYLFGDYPSILKGNEIVEYWLNNIVHPDDAEEQRKYINNMELLPPKRTYRIIHPLKGIRTIQVEAKKNRLSKRNILSVNFC